MQSGFFGALKHTETDLHIDANTFCQNFDSFYRKFASFAQITGLTGFLSETEKRREWGTVGLEGFPLAGYWGDLRTLMASHVSPER